MHTSTISYVSYRKKSLSPLLRAHIVHRLRMIDQNTILGAAMFNFAADAASKTEDDYHDLLLAIQKQINEDVQVTRKVLGPHYRFFRKLVD